MSDSNNTPCFTRQVKEQAVLWHWKRVPNVSISNFQFPFQVMPWTKDLAKRTAAAVRTSRMFPQKLYLALYRPREVSLQFIRWIWSTLFRPTCHRAAVETLRPLMLRYL